MKNLKMHMAVRGYRCMGYYYDVPGVSPIIEFELSQNISNRIEQMMRSTITVFVYEQHLSVPVRREGRMERIDMRDHKEKYIPYYCFIPEDFRGNMSQHVFNRADRIYLAFSSCEDLPATFSRVVKGEM